MKTREEVVKKLRELHITREATPVYADYEFGSTYERLRTPESEHLDAQIEALQWVIDTSP